MDTQHFGFPEAGDYASLVALLLDETDAID
jgi:hypothetical protein